MKPTQAEAKEALERLWMARDLTHPDAMIMWYDIIHTSFTQSAARIAELEAERDEARNALCADGIYRSIQGYILAHWDDVKSSRAYPGYPGPLDIAALEPFLLPSIEINSSVPQHNG